MTDGPQDGLASSIEPVTQQLPKAGEGARRASGRAASNSEVSPEDFAPAEGPTLSSPSSDPAPATTLRALESRLRHREKHIDAIERELADIVGAVEDLLKRQETVERTLQQQRHGRYVMWGTLIAILAILWITLRSRLGLPGPN